MTEEEIQSKKSVTNVDFKDRKLFESLETGSFVDINVLL